MDENFLEGCAHHYTDLPDGSFVCTICGLNVSKWGEVLPAPPAFCTACSAPWTAGSLTCLHCGATSQATARRRQLLMGGPADRADTRAAAPQPAPGEQPPEYMPGVTGEPPPVLPGGFDELEVMQLYKQPPVGEPPPSFQGQAPAYPPQVTPPVPPQGPGPGYGYGGAGGVPPGAPIVGTGPARAARPIPWMSLLLVTIIGSIGLAAIIGVVMIATAHVDLTAYRVLGIIFSIGVYGLLALATWTLYERGRYRTYALIVLPVTGVALLATLIGSFAESSAGMVKFGSAAAIVAWTCAQVSLLLLIRQDNDYVKASSFITIGFAAVFALLLIYPIAVEFKELNVGYFKLLGVVAVIDLAGSIVSPVLSKLVHAREDRAA